MSFLLRLRRALRSFLDDDQSRVVALRQQAAAASAYAFHVAMMRRCVDELRREVRACERRLEAIPLTRAMAADLEQSRLELEDAIAEFETQKAELDAMIATQARQEERFAQNKLHLLSGGFAVENIALVTPDAETAEHDADSLMASLELDAELSGRPTLELH